MCSETDKLNELLVTFHPALYLQRRGWVLDEMRRESVAEVLDIGCGEGELLCCLCNPAPWLAPPPEDVLSSIVSPLPKSSDEVDAPAELHRDILHPLKISGLDISLPDLECTVQITRPQPPEPEDAPYSWYTAAIRWEPLQVNIWQGGLEHVSPAFVGVECIVATEVIEHLPQDVLDRFAPVVLGAYHPRILLLTTPSFTFNARFTAPDAPAGARSGWRDPTGRTERVFRHHDHKFEWTPEEFEQWCTNVADEWGYEVEIGGVGKAHEVDEWGRDEQLGWASQVAAFKRREGTGWEERRKNRWEGLKDPRGAAQTPVGMHQLLAAHQHPAHAVARHPQPLDVIGDLVVSRMIRYRETALALTEMWFEREVELACGGWIDLLIHAVRAHNGLALQKTVLNPGIHDEWVIQLDPVLHHLIVQESHTDPLVSPPDSDEVVDPGLDDGDRVCAAWGGIVVRHGDDATTGGDWGEMNAGELFDDNDWGEPEEGWGTSKPGPDLPPETSWS